jgi:O-antigen biosynthesis protein
MDDPDQLPMQVSQQNNGAARGHERRNLECDGADSVLPLSSIFIEHAGNLSDKWEHYLAIYDAEMARFRNAGRPIRLLEIGVQNGGSLQAFARYLPEGSSILGIDVDPACAELSLGPNIRVAIVDAGDPAVLDAALGNERFDLILDDGSHQSDQIITAFHVCFDRLEPGGLYIIEDLHAGYWSAFGGGFRRQNAAVESFKAMVDALNVDHIEGDLETQLTGTELDWLRHAGAQLGRISFYDSVAVLEKLTEPKRGAYRRIFTGRVAPVSDPSSQFGHLPISQLRNLILAPTTASAFTPILLEAVAAAREEVGRLSADLGRAEQRADERAAVVQSQADSIIRGLISARAEAEERAAVAQSQADSIVHGLISARAEAEERRAATEAHAAAAEAQLATLRASTTWKMTRPVRQFAEHLPPSVRRIARRSAKAGWWAITGQLPSRLRAWRQFRSQSFSPRTHTKQVPPALNGPNKADESYNAWYAAHKPSGTELALQRRLAAALAVQPRFSILVPVFKTPTDIFIAMVRSVEMQSYEHWELCLAVVDSGLETEALLGAAQDVAGRERRIRLTVLPENRGIAGNSNAALDLATGDWAALLDHDDLLSPEALYRFAEAINANPKADFLYSDKDMVDRDESRHYAPLFKPAWSPEAMLNSNYLTHLCTIPMERMRAIGGWDPHTDGAQDWDLFLRAIGTGGQVVHVPHVLYHWRHIETSVAAGGLAAKPYAAAGQLRTLKKFLPVAGWTGATPRFEGLSLRIVWDAERRSQVSVVVVGGPAAEYHRIAVALGAAEVISAEGHDLADAIDSAIAGSRGDTILLVDVGFVPEAPEWVDELALPLLNPAIALVAGKVMDASRAILDYGVYLQDGAAYPAFRGAHEHCSGPSGGSIWYRNAVTVAGGALGFRRATWKAVGGFGAHKAAGRADLAFALEITRRGLGRIMINPFARFRATSGPCSFEARASAPLNTETIRAACPEGDPYLNLHLDAAVSSGPPALRPVGISQRTAASTNYPDFKKDARDIAIEYDVTSDQIADSVAATTAAPGGPLRRVIWFIPGFEVPFYGGIHTILRAAEYMRTRHGIVSTFAVLGGHLSAETISGRIAQAFPALAEAAAVETVRSSEALLDLDGTDAGIATLWTTAYALLHQRGLRRKFYFVQDWEPLFYPAGAISAAAEATYRFGFHAVCNTPALAESYRALGGSADHFFPAVDAAVFNPRGRASRKANDPFLLFCYLRPNTPRNGFETVVEALRLLKKQYGEKLQVVTAGADWAPEDYGLGGIISNLGLLPYESTGTVYRTVDAGLVMMATRHPSYLPFELMACGAAVITNRNPYTAWLLRDGGNCVLCEMTRSDIATAVKQVIENRSLCETLAMRAESEIEARYSDWNVTCERIFTIMRDVTEVPLG